MEKKRCTKHKFNRTNLSDRVQFSWPFRVTGKFELYAEKKFDFHDMAEVFSCKTTKRFITLFSKQQLL